MAHPNCAVTAPKTCGLPVELAKHFADSVEKSAEVAVPNVTTDGACQGWVDLMQ